MRIHHALWERRHGLTYFHHLWSSWLIWILICIEIFICLNPIFSWLRFCNWLIIIVRIVLSEVFSSKSILHSISRNLLCLLFSYILSSYILYWSLGLYSSCSFWRKVSSVSKWYSLILIRHSKLYLWSWRHNYLWFVISWRYYSLLASWTPICSSTKSFISVYRIIVNCIIVSIGNKSCFTLNIYRLSNDFVQLLRNILRRLISIPNSKMSKVIINLVKILWWSTFHRFSSSLRIIIYCFWLIISHHSIKLI